MKKAGLIVCGFAMLATLTGCKDAVADISNGSEKLVSVGDTTITKDKLYNLLKGSNGGSATIELVQNKIYEKEGIKLSEDMKKEAKKTLASTKKTFGGEEAFLNAIKRYGFKSEEEYLEKASYPSLLNKELLKKYAKDNQKTLFEKYHPVKANVIQVEKQENAEKALAALKKGDSAKTVAKKYGKTGTYDGSEKIYFSGSGLPDVVFSKITATSSKGLIKEVIEDTEGKTYYLVNLTNIDPSSFADEANDALVAGVSDLSNTMMEHYLKKYNFTIYDIDILNQIKSTNESYITQK